MKCQCSHTLVDTDASNCLFSLAGLCRIIDEHVLIVMGHVMSLTFFEPGFSTVKKFQQGFLSVRAADVLVC